jgi:hypothetical protein
VHVTVQFHHHLPCRCAALQLYLSLTTMDDLSRRAIISHLQFILIVPGCWIHNLRSFNFLHIRSISKSLLNFTWQILCFTNL